ncbi:cupin domain-containing protein [Roseibium sp. SCP14]|uniref:cupin domain-containing protein n=1 Tax=Roseibium sp. SCP14 TaxID=3141375 RepID=UPI00333962FA
MRTNQITRVDQSVAKLADTIPAEKLISGKSPTSLWNAFSDTSEQFYVGQWSSEACKLHVSYSENELCVLVEGTVRMENSDGESWTFVAGDAFVIPAGFAGTWESVTPVRKIYAAFEAAPDPGA